MADNFHYYNLLVHIISNDQLIEENAALKNIWNKDGNIMLNLYFYRHKVSKVIDGAYIHDIVDLATEKYYTRCEELLEDYQKIQLQEQDAAAVKAETPQGNAYQFDFKHLEDIKDDIIILVFVARCIDYYSDIKKKTIHAYLKKLHPNIKNLSPQYIEAYLQEINPNEIDFYQALDNIKHKTPEEAEDLAREVVKICVSDGVMAYNEKIFIAEILQTLREHGLEPDVGL